MQPQCNQRSADKQKVKLSLFFLQPMPITENITPSTTVPVDVVDGHRIAPQCTIQQLGCHRMCQVKNGISSKFKNDS
jgi:hypothetical protein